MTSEEKNDTQENVKNDDSQETENVAHENPEKISENRVPYIPIPITEDSIRRLQRAGDRSRYGKKYHNERLIPQKLEYFGTYLPDGNAIIYTHGKCTRPIKTCLLRSVEPQLNADLGDSWVYEIIRMVSFEPPVELPEEPPGVQEEPSAPEEEVVAPPPPPPPVVAPPVVRVKRHFKARGYNLKDLDIDEDAPVFVFKIKEGESSHQYIAEWKEAGRDTIGRVKESAHEWFCWMEETMPEFTEHAVKVYETGTFWGLILWQLWRFIYRGEIFVPNETKQVSPYYTTSIPHQPPKHRTKSVQDNFPHIEPVQDAISHAKATTDPPTILELEPSEAQILTTTYTGEEMQNDIDDHDRSEAGELEILPRLLTDAAENDSEADDGDVIYLVHYQLIHQISKYPTILAAFGYLEPEYFYHKFVFFEPDTNKIHYLCVGVDDDVQVARLNDFCKTNKHLMAYRYDAGAPDRFRYVKKYYSHTMFIPVADDRTDYVSEFTDESTKDCTWEGWLKKRALNSGILDVHKTYANNVANNELKNSCVESLLKFVKK